MNPKDKIPNGKNPPQTNTGGTKGGNDPYIYRDTLEHAPADWNKLAEEMKKAMSLADFVQHIQYGAPCGDKTVFGLGKLKYVDLDKHIVLISAEVLNEKIKSINNERSWFWLTRAFTGFSFAPELFGLYIYNSNYFRTGARYIYKVTNDTYNKAKGQRLELLKRSEKYALERSLKLKVLGQKLGYLGVLISLSDIVGEGEITPGNSTEFGIACISLTGYGLVISGIYFIGDIASQIATGKPLASHINYVCDEPNKKIINKWIEIENDCKRWINSNSVAPYQIPGL